MEGGWESRIISEEIGLWILMDLKDPKRKTLLQIDTATEDAAYRKIKLCQEHLTSK